MTYYVIKEKYSIPGFLFTAVSSWVITILVLTFASLAAWAALPGMQWETHSWLALPLIVIIVYGALGAFSLYMLMWVYWASVERASFAGRLGWMLLLIFGLHYGAVIYALVVWKRDMRSLSGSQPLVGGGGWPTSPDTR